MNTQVEDILDRILQSYPQTVFTKNIEFIKKTNANLEDVDTIQSIKTLAILLEVLGNAELALQTSSIIDKIEFTGDMLIWEKVRDVLILEYFIYQERKEFQKAKAIMDKMTLVLERGDEARVTLEYEDGDREKVLIRGILMKKVDNRWYCYIV